jgi:cupin 2 domain-containing protein
MPHLHLVTNLFQNLPTGNQEIIELLAKSEAVTIERIVSNGQPSPPYFWYDQAQNEWVLLIQGTASLEFEGSETKQLQAGDYLLIPSHSKHPVSEVSRDAIWLAVHLPESHLRS